MLGAWASSRLLQTVRVAGLLHDVGKIGIPDHILRKPGKLTAAEYEVVQQHVVLGDMIVRDLPDVEAIRAGVRHHHERWDGTGYVDRLAGEGIPLIARILAISDAFSAMTTTRPYRKALDVREALMRLEDAAGTQLDEALVVAFVDGIENVAGAPLPGWTLRVSGRRTPASPDGPASTDATSLARAGPLARTSSQLLRGRGARVRFGARRSRPGQCLDPRAHAAERSPRPTHHDRIPGDQRK